MVADELQQVFGDRLPVSNLRPALASVQFVGERGQRHDLARPAAADQAVVDAGAVGLPYAGVEQGGRGHDGRVDLLGGGRVVGLVRKQEIALGIQRNWVI